MTGNALAILEAGLAASATAALAAGGIAYAANWPTSQLFGRALTAPRNPQSGPGEIALTFDDGPHPRWTPPRPAPEFIPPCSWRRARSRS